MRARKSIRVLTFVYFFSRSELYSWNFLLCIYRVCCLACVALERFIKRFSLYLLLYNRATEMSACDLKGIFFVVF